MCHKIFYILQRLSVRKNVTDCEIKLKIKTLPLRNVIILINYTHKCIANNINFHYLYMNVYDVPLDVKNLIYNKLYIRI